MNKIQFPELFKYQHVHTDKINLTSKNYLKKMPLNEFIFRFNKIDIIETERPKLIRLYNKF